MKNQNVKVLALVVVGATIFSACNPLSKMIKRQGEVNYEVTPNPVELHGDSIEISVNGSFPTKYFHKKISATVTPVLKYGDNSESYAPFFLKGEDSEAEGTVIKFESGGSFSHKAKVAYKPGMEVATIELLVAGEYKGKKKELDPREVADGTIITPLLVQTSDKPILGADKFVKFTLENNNVEIHYVVNRSVVRGSQLSDKDIRDLKSKIAAWTKDDKMEFNSMVIDAYASPEGEISKNDNLANERAASASKAMSSILNKAGVKTPAGFAALSGKGEDWEGFKQLMTESNIKDKELIIRVLGMYSNLDEREREIKNLAATYTQVAKKILPPLRRSQVNLVMKHHNLTDAEIKALVDSKIDSLDEEQMLYAATLYDDMAKKESIYKSFSKIHSKDWRGPNNVGYIYVAQNKLSDAKAEFDKAMGLSAENPVVYNNLGIIERLNGNIDKALDYFKKAAGAGNEVSENMGIIYITKGDYVSAVSSFSGVSSFNAALANVLNGDNASATKALQGSDDNEEAISHYLKAIIAARSGDTDIMVNSLKTAISKDASLKAKAKDDAEFIKFRDNADFQAAVN